MRTCSVLVAAMLALAFLSGCKENLEKVVVKARAMVVTANGAGVPTNDWTLVMSPDQSEVPRGATITYTVTWTRMAEGYEIDNWAVVRYEDVYGGKHEVTSNVVTVHVTDPALGLEFLLPLPQVTQGTGTVQYVDNSLLVDGEAATPGTDETTGWWLYDYGDLPGSGGGSLQYGVKVN